MSFWGPKGRKEERHTHTHTQKEKEERKNWKEALKGYKAQGVLAVAVIKNLPWDPRSHKACAPHLEKPTHYN